MSERLDSLLTDRQILLEQYEHCEHIIGGTIAQDADSDVAMLAWELSLRIGDKLNRVEEEIETLVAAERGVSH